ncbi:MAG: hypothetical protein DRI90_20680 [Deltaproteobacteria bacterium]|nr:MAG: hypothetical protein DRI90_20680 [Deltaproteobacteria bacterium]
MGGSGIFSRTLALLSAALLLLGVATCQPPLEAHPAPSALPHPAPASPTASRSPTLALSVEPPPPDQTVAPASSSPAPPAVVPLPVIVDGPAGVASCIESVRHADGAWPPGTQPQWFRWAVPYAARCESGEGAACRRLAAEFFDDASSVNCRATLLRARCEAKDAEACLLLGALHEQSIERARARPWLRRACDGGLDLGCWFLRVFDGVVDQAQLGTVCAAQQPCLSLGRTILESTEGHGARGMAVLEAACGSDPRACLVLADFEARLAVDEESETAQRAVAGRVHRSCAGAGAAVCDARFEELLRGGTLLNPDVDPRRRWLALHLLADRCVRRGGEPCSWAALYAVALDGQSPPFNPSEYLERGCTTGHDLSCALGVALAPPPEGSIGPRQYTAEQKQQLQRGCAASQAPACARFVGKFRGHSTLPGPMSAPGPRMAFADVSRLEPLARTACDVGQPIACAVLGDADGPLAGQDERLTVLRRACPRSRPDGRGCSQLADLLFESGANAEALQALERACRQGISCSNLGLKLLAGNVGPADRPRGLRLLDRACRKREAHACLWLAREVEDSDPARAEKLKDLARDYMY